MKMKVYSTSGPAWQPVKNGQAYNKWVGTIQFTDTEHVCFGHRFTATVSGKTKEEVIEKLDKFHIGDVVNVSPNRLNPDPALGVINARTRR